jgi:flagellar basal body rod protein FlgF
MNITITADTAQALTVLASVPGLTNRAMVGATNDVTSLTLREMKIYAPPIALRISSATGARLGNGYRRTGTLRKSWFKQIQNSGREVIGLVISNGNIAPYNVYVQKEGSIAWMHRGRWETEVEVVNRLRPQYDEMYRLRLQSMLSSLRT